MRRFYGRRSGDKVVVEGEEHYHLLRVDRMREGELIRVVLEQGYLEFEARIEELGRSETLCGIVRECEPVVVPEIELALAVVKTSVMDECVCRASEFGVSRFQPVISSRSLQNLNRMEKVRARWKKIHREAVKQSGMLAGMEMFTPERFQSLLGHLSSNAVLFHPSGDVKRPSLDRDKPVRIFIGPEGGFAEEEVESAREKGVAVVSLGPGILRVETAVPAALAVVNGWLQDQEQ